MKDPSLSPTSTAATLATYAATSSSASNPPTPEETRPGRKSPVRRWFNAFKHYASLKTLRTESPSRGDGVATVRSSVEVSDPASTPPSSLSPMTTGDYASSEIKAVPTIVVTEVTPSAEDTVSPTNLSPITPSANANDNLSPTTAAPASAAPKARGGRRHRHRHPTMLTPELMREIEKANKQHHDIVMRDEEKHVMRKIFSEPVVSPRATQVRANPLRWGQE